MLLSGSGWRLLFVGPLSPCLSSAAFRLFTLKNYVICRLYAGIVTLQGHLPDCHRSVKRIITVE